MSWPRAKYFSSLAWPVSVNKHFITWPPLFFQHFQGRTECYDFSFSARAIAHGPHPEILLYFPEFFFNKTAYRSLRDPTMRTVKFSSPHHMFLKLLHIQCCRFTPMWLIIARRPCHRDPFSHARLMTLLEYGTLKKVMIISVLCKVLRILCFTIWFLLCLILISWFYLRI